MSLNQNNINSIKNTLTSTSDIVTNISDTVTSAVQDPIGTAIRRVLFKVNSLTVNITDKIDSLSNNFTLLSNNSAKVTLEGDTIVLTTNPTNLQQATQLQSNIQKEIESITRIINILSTTLNTLAAISATAEILLKIISVQEAALKANPATGPMFMVFKKAIKIVFLKEILKENLKVVRSQLAQNNVVLNRLKNKFNNLKVNIKVDDNNNTVGTNAAQNLVVNDLLGGDDIKKINNTYEEFTNNLNNTYILKVEKYGEKMLIGKAYDKFSGLLYQQTAPSFVSTSQELMEELKQILNQE